MENDKTCIAVHGVPRSGTSWIGEIFNSSPNTHYRFQPLFSYAHKNFLGETSSSEDISEFFSRQLICEDDFTTQLTKRVSGVLPTFKKRDITHIVYKETQSHNMLFNMMRRAQWVKLCPVIRNPLSVMSSWFKAPLDFRTDLGWSEVDEWRYALKKNMNRPELYYGFERWKEASNIFLYLKNEFPDRVHIIQYAKLLEDRASEARRLFEFCGLEYTELTAGFLETSCRKLNADPYSVFRNNQSDGKWEHDLMNEIADEIRADLRGTILEEYL